MIVVLIVIGLLEGSERRVEHVAGDHTRKLSIKRFLFGSSGHPRAPNQAVSSVIRSFGTVSALSSKPLGNLRGWQRAARRNRVGLRGEAFPGKTLWLLIRGIKVRACYIHPGCGHRNNDRESVDSTRSRSSCRGYVAAGGGGAEPPRSMDGSSNQNARVVAPVFVPVGGLERKRRQLMARLLQGHWR